MNAEERDTLMLEERQRAEDTKAILAQSTFPAAMKEDIKMQAVDLILWFKLEHPEIDVLPIWKEVFAEDISMLELITTHCESSNTNTLVTKCQNILSSFTNLD